MSFYNLGPNIKLNRDNEWIILLIFKEIKKKYQIYCHSLKESVTHMHKDIVGTQCLTNKISCLYLEEIWGCYIV